MKCFSLQKCFWRSGHLLALTQTDPIAAPAGTSLFGWKWSHWVSLHFWFPKKRPKKQIIAIKPVFFISLLHLKLPAVHTIEGLLFSCLVITYHENNAVVIPSWLPWGCHAEWQSPGQRTSWELCCILFLWALPCWIGWFEFFQSQKRFTGTARS